VHVAGHKLCAGALKRNLPCARRARGAGRGRAQDHGVHPPSQARARLPAQRPALHVRPFLQAVRLGPAGQAVALLLADRGSAPPCWHARCGREQSNGYFRAPYDNKAAFLLAPACASTRPTSPPCHCQVPDAVNVSVFLVFSALSCIAAGMAASMGCLGRPRRALLVSRLPRLSRR